MGLIKRPRTLKMTPPGYHVVKKHLKVSGTGINYYGFTRLIVGSFSKSSESTASLPIKRAGIGFTRGNKFSLFND